MKKKPKDIVTRNFSMQPRDAKTIQRLAEHWRLNLSATVRRAVDEAWAAVEREKREQAKCE